MAEGVQYPTNDHISADSEPAEVEPETEETTETAEATPEVPGAA